jgi:gluconolactonase
VSADGSSVTTLYTECDGLPLIAPNDLVFDTEGNFYFTDMGRTLGRQRDIAGVFFATPDGKMIREIAFPMEMANGCSLSPDGKTLYVAETATARVHAFALAGPGQVKSRRILATVTGVPPGYAAAVDSMCVDGMGNVVQATLRNGGITTITPSGAMTHVPTGDSLTTNCCFAGPDLRTLYVTLGSSGKLAAFDNWPVPGYRLPFQAQVSPGQQS